MQSNVHGYLCRGYDSKVVRRRYVFNRESPVVVAGGLGPTNEDGCALHGPFPSHDSAGYPRRVERRSLDPMHGVSTRADGH
jgi:hypothetical protein